MKRGSVHRVYDTGVRRSWHPRDKATARQQDIVLNILIEQGEIEQKDLVDLVWEQLPERACGTAASAVSATLLALHEAEMVEVTTFGRNATWRVK